ncbi:C2 and GRAM domain-containing protein [Apostasia shenzhenica]|uniref:C2 and GRAM domain-containing protein n=1 Tax=Apostasia shenzhenica TaxID=1088818 RepID=A0A2I0A5U2_9ASPA|nr:C2 and GRAM domain-containing protein [Apostasia shenzhenica]
MANGGGRRLVVEVCNARNLMPKDGQGTASAYVVVDFDGQRRKTKTKLRDLNPQWDEKHEFFVHDPDSMAAKTLEVNIYNDKKNARRSTFLGKVKITGSMFAKSGAESLIYYPLEKRSVFSQVKGEIGLKVYYADEAPLQPFDAPPDGEQKSEATPAPEDKMADEQAKHSVEERKTEEEKTAEDPKVEAKKPEETEKTEENPLKKDEKKRTPATATAVLQSPARKLQHPGFSDLEIKPHRNERAGGSYDLVDRVPYLFIRLLKAKQDGGGGDAAGERSVLAKIVIGTHIARTRAVKLSLEWDQVFAFRKECLSSTALEISVLEEKDGDAVAEASLGTVSFELSEIPKRSPPDSPLAPQWYTLEDSSPETAADVMVAVWIGSQADELFQEAWQSDSGGLLVHTRSKAYLSPKLWYLRLTVIQTQDLRLYTGPDKKSRTPAAAGGSLYLYVKAQLGGQIFKTAKMPLCSSSSSAANPSWNDDLIFVAAEPFDPFLTISVEDATAGGETIGQAKVPLVTIHRRLDNLAEPQSRWLNLSGDEAHPYAGRIHVRLCLEGGYHVLDEAAVGAASKQPSKPAIGLLQVGVRGASNLLPVKLAADGASGSTDAYVVLKYGSKWVRTRTIIDQFNPRWNEQYAWDVFDPCTVLTVAVFDNSRINSGATAPAGGKSPKDSRIGKVRIRLSTLCTNRIYTTSFPLIVVTPLGARKMGELELAIRFSCTSWLSLLQAYTTPVLPRMHFARPLGATQQDVLRHAAIRAVAARLERSEPPLGAEVVHQMLDSDAHLWSMRRSRANWFRIVGCLSGVAAAARWVYSMRTWEHPVTTMLAHLLLLALVLRPELILPTVMLYMSIVVAWRYRRRAGGPGGIDPKLSCVDGVGMDELDEEMDRFPTSRSPELVKARYDRLRAVAGRAQTLMGDVAAMAERVEAMVTWRDPRATGMFVTACVAAAAVFYAVPFRLVAAAWGFYYLRHPRFRGDMPPAAVNYFRRLPSMADLIL